MRRRMLIVAAALAALLLGAQAALAGGWVVLTLDELPAQVRAGESFQLGFTVRQHGQTPINSDFDGNLLKPVISAQQAGMQQALTFEARQAGATGHFVADVTLPAAGEWAWSIAVPPFAIPTGSERYDDQLRLKPLTVLAAVPAQATAAPAQPAPAAAPASAPAGRSPAWLPWAGGAPLVLAIVLVWLLAQRRRSAARGQAG